MRLDPVFLVEPKPAAPSMPTRRAFLLAGGTLFAGISIGGAGVYAIFASTNVGRSRTSGKIDQNPAEPDLEPSGDADLDFLRNLAVKAPIAELAHQRLMFVNATFMDYPRDPILWRGISRLCDYVLAGNQMDNRAQFARALAAVIEKADTAVSAAVRHHVEALRRVK
jgi:hypothetical protein